jgi:hypothetical protein
MLSSSRGNVSHGLGVVITAMLVTACGVPPEPVGLDDRVPEVTFVALEQYSTPALVTQSGEPDLYHVTVDVTVTLRFADQLEVLIVDIDSPSSGRESHNQFDLTAVAPEIAAATQGRFEVRLPLTIPELGALQFSVTVIDRNGKTSRAVEGGFTVQSALGANDTNEAQNTEGMTTSEFQDR